MMTSEIAWCRDPAAAEAVARLFVAETELAYISHSELQFGRALAPGRWALDLEAKIATEATRAVERAIAGAPTGTRLAVLHVAGIIQGFAFVTFTRDLHADYATLEDLIIAEGSRGRGAGGRMLDWVVAECRAQGFPRLFLESGFRNERAHHFFEAQGFRQTSIVMMRDL